MSRLRNVAELYAIGIVKLAGQNRISNQDVLTTPLDDLVDDYEKQVIEDALFLYSGKVSGQQTTYKFREKTVP